MSSPVRLRGAVLRDGRIVRGEVAVHAGRVVADARGGSARPLPEGWLIAPGFVDVQVNGLAGAEVGEDPAANAAVALALPRAGVTAFCPTLVTRSDEGYRRAAAGLAATRWPAGGARPLGVHLEGPFLSPAHAGAHDGALMRPPRPDAVRDLLRRFTPAILTLAPELPGGMGAIRRSVAAGTVAAVGHTGADAGQGRAAIAAGARLIVHAMNAMPPITARRPTALTAFLADAEAHVSLIADGVHVASEVAVLLARLAGPRLTLVSDAVAAAGARPGAYGLGAGTVCSDGRRATRDGRLAGSLAGLDAGPRILVASGVGRAAAVSAAAEAPRRLMRLPGLVPGAPADLVVLDAGGVPRLTVIGGRAVHDELGLGSGLTG